MKHYLFIFFMMALCFCKEAIAKNNRELQQEGSITGTVTDKSGAPIPGAAVNVKNTKLATLANAAGKFSFTNVAYGKYTVVASAIGYKSKEAVITVSENTAPLSITIDDDILSLGEVVVTGFSNPKKKLESSVAITTFRASKIEELAPTSAATLLKSVPGFAVESSGGEVGNNVFARGIPSAGAYEFIQIQEDGLPVFEDGALQFGNADNWFRLDETLARVEAIRGGSGSIFASNAPGGIVDFISKNGTNQFDGKIKLTRGTAGLFRTDLNIGGALIPDKLFYNIGGFYRVDDGVRSPGFKANNGGQIKMNLKYNLNNGYIKLFYKKLDDRNLFLLPIPLTDKDHPKGIDGFDPNYGTLTSINYSNLKVPQYGGGYFTRDLTNGVHPIVDAVGGEIKTDLGSGFSLSNNLRYTNINMDYTAIFPGDEPQTASAFAANYSSNGVNYPISNPGYFYANTGQVANPSLVAKLGYWAIDKKMNNFANNLRINYATEGLNLSLGYYYSNWTSNQTWNWSNVLVEVSDKPQLLNLVDKSLAPGSANYSRTYNGVSEISFLTRQAQTQGNLNAVFANAEITANDKLTFDLGLRFDMDRYKGYKANTTTHSLRNNGSFDFDFNSTTAGNKVSSSEGPYYYWKYDLNRLSASAAANYKFNSEMAAYFRYSNGFRAPLEEAFYDNAENLDRLKPTVINQYELGYKYQAKTFAVFANLFYMGMDNIAFTDVLANGTSENKFAKADNIGLELESEFNFDRFTLNVTGTIQQPKFKDFSGAGFDYNNNVVRRIPRVYGAIRPSYKITKDLLVYAAYNYFGKKYSDNANVFALPGFGTLDAGVSYKIKKIRFAVDATNLTNAIGLTEGNPRITSSPGSIYYARPILGAAGRLSVAYDF